MMVLVYTLRKAFRPKITERAPASLNVRRKGGCEPASRRFSLASMSSSDIELPNLQKPGLTSCMITSPLV